MAFRPPNYQSYNPPPQYYPPQGYGPEPPAPYEYLSVFTIIGVIMFILPWFNNVLNWGMPSILMWIGLLFIILGLIHTIARFAGW
jgi:hypothetical protein